VSDREGMEKEEGNRRWM